jgi:hypothetical protein
MLLQPASQVAPFYDLRVQSEEGINWLRLGLSLYPDGQPKLRAQALVIFSDLIAMQGDWVTSRIHLERALVLFRELGDQRGFAWTSIRLGSLQPSYVQQCVLLQERLATFRALNDRRGIADTLNSLGWGAAGPEGFAQQEQRYEEALALGRGLHDLHGIIFGLRGLAAIAQRAGDYEREIALATELMTYLRELDNRNLLAIQVGAIGSLGLSRAIRSGAKPNSTTVLHAASCLDTRTGLPTPHGHWGEWQNCKASMSRRQPCLSAALRCIVRWSMNGTLPRCCADWGGSQHIAAITPQQ